MWSICLSVYFTSLSLSLVSLNQSFNQSVSHSMTYQSIILSMIYLYQSIISQSINLSINYLSFNQSSISQVIDLSINQLINQSLPIDLSIPQSIIYQLIIYQSIINQSLNQSSIYLADKWIYYQLNCLGASWAWSAGYGISESGDFLEDQLDKNLLILPNHQSSSDVPLLFSVCTKPGLSDHVMWVIDSNFKYTSFGLIGEWGPASDRTGRGRTFAREIIISDLVLSSRVLIIFATKIILALIWNNRRWSFFNPLVPKAPNSECQIPLQIKPGKSVKASWRIFIFCTLGTNGLGIT